MSEKITIIRSIKKFQFSFKNIWEYRELFLFFSIRDIKLRYRYLHIAIFWAVVPPLLMSFVFNLSFGQVIKVNPPFIPYLMFAYLGLVFWNLYSSIVFRSSSSLINNNLLITKTYFPRILLPLSSATVCLIDFFFVLIVFFLLAFYYQINLNLISFIYFIPVVLITYLFASGLGMFFSALNIKYKDTREILPLLTSLLFFLTPVIYPVKLTSHLWYPVLYLNPMMGVIETARTVLFELAYTDIFGLFISTISALIVFIIGYIYFQITEKEMADII